MDPTNCKGQLQRTSFSLLKVDIFSVYRACGPYMQQFLLLNKWQMPCEIYHTFFQVKENSLMIHDCTTLTTVLLHNRYICIDFTLFHHRNLALFLGLLMLQVRKRYQKLFMAPKVAKHFSFTWRTKQCNLCMNRLERKAGKDPGCRNTVINVHFTKQSGKYFII